MNTFYIITNHHKDEKLEVTRQIKGYLEENGKTCYIQQEAKEGTGTEDYKFTNAAEIPADVECVLVLGGDGTLIQAARDTIKRNIPLLGFNFGTLGFLAEIEKENMYTALDKLMNDEFYLESRMMLTGTVYRDGKAMETDIALNDIVLNRSGALRTINYEIYVNGDFLYSCPADGIIISTPTGSTGYNLSARGPIVSPSSSMILLTPICPHSLTSSSIVLSAEDKVAVKLGPGRKNANEAAVVTFDGAQSVNLIIGDYVEITQAKETTRLVKISKKSFVETVRKKMQFN
ncbi:MAG: NAD(+)/NADH kinase [Lachnospiraceae bacterium]|nr:NAD(+)/NADH kinase [Lachnospiraceae bacterium]